MTEMVGGIVELIKYLYVIALLLFMINVYIWTVKYFLPPTWRRFFIWLPFLGVGAPLLLLWMIKIDQRLLWIPIFAATRIVIYQISRGIEMVRKKR